MRLHRITGTAAAPGPLRAPARAGTGDTRGAARAFPADLGLAPTLHRKIGSTAVADREAARGAGAGRNP